MIDLKFIAFLTMALDHIGLVLGPEYWPLRAIGRFSFPLFALLVGFGANKTHDFSSYIKRLAALAFVSQIPFYLFVGSGLNVLFTFLLGLSIYYLVGQGRLYSALVIFILSVALNVDYGPLGVLLTFLFSLLFYYRSISLPFWPWMRSRSWFLFYPAHLLILVLYRDLFLIS